MTSCAASSAFQTHPLSQLLSQNASTMTVTCVLSTGCRHLFRSCHYQQISLRSVMTRSRNARGPHSVHGMRPVVEVRCYLRTCSLLHINLSRSVMVVKWLPLKKDYQRQTYVYFSTLIKRTYSGARIGNIGPSRVRLVGIGIVNGQRR